MPTGPLILSLRLFLSLRLSLQSGAEPAPEFGPCPPNRTLNSTPGLRDRFAPPLGAISSREADQAPGKSRRAGTRVRVPEGRGWASQCWNLEGDQSFHCNCNPPMTIALKTTSWYGDEASSPPEEQRRNDESF